ncbi:Hypothetical predicted protein [Xyrichtys novacula]|uniref:Uncharacterized protein n=1 Tax=Xyrichtys novacula TaxID=13765 RepID=A0AAV1ET32_XYRNO|nr:Hypothetical predicted protein [Xyrichtys novacula]
MGTHLEQLSDPKATSSSGSPPTNLAFPIKLHVFCFLHHRLKDRKHGACVPRQSEAEVCPTRAKTATESRDLCPEQGDDRVRAAAV